MTGTRTWPDHLLDLDEWDALPEERTRRAELVEGVLLVAPRPLVGHQRAVARVLDRLRAVLPRGWEAVPDVEILVDAGPPPTVRVPDVVVLPTAVPDDARRCRGTDVLGVVEVLSPGSVRTDRVAKADDYARAGVARYVLVDAGPPTTVTALLLTDDGWVPDPRPWGLP